MLGKKKRVVSLLLVFAMLLVTLCACGAQESGGQSSPAAADTQTEKQPEAAQDGTQEATQEAEAGPDISEEVTLVMYLIGDGLLVSLPDSANYAYDSNCNWGVRNDAYWRMIEGGIPNMPELNAVWQETARSERYQTFVFNDESVKNEIAAIGEIFDTDYKLLGLGFTDDPEADIAKLREKMEAAGAQKVYDEIQKQALAYLETQ